MEQNVKKKKYANSLWIIILPLIVFCALGAFVATERAGISLDRKAQLPAEALLPQEAMVKRSDHKPDIRCLLICDSSEDYTYQAIGNITFVLDQMSVGYTLMDLAKNQTLPDLKQYKTIVIASAEFTPLDLSFDAIFDWVKAGGGLLFAQTPAEHWLYLFHSKDIGLASQEFSLVPQVIATMDTDFMAGGRGMNIQWSEDNSTEYRTGGNFKLDKSCIVHMTSTGPQGPTPLLWEKRLDNGKVVVNNNDAFNEIISRGLVAAAYSLTEPAVAYPVINASLYFIDDFPSPIPEGYNQYIQKDYGVNTEYFYVYIWFPDMLRIAQKHKIKYTSVFIESYNDIVTPPFPPMTPEIVERMKYFGTLYMNEGYEMGFHGYNHQPLVFPDFDYKGLLPYHKWPDEADALDALGDAVHLENDMFPNMVMKTYVPPSNVLSHEGRAMLKKKFPQLTVISGLLLDDDYNLNDNFGVADDGFINIPRIVAGYAPFDDSDSVLANWFFLSELNLHFVNSQFIHPDDALDPERGATIGWKTLSESFDDHLTWMDQFPLRNMTAQEAAPAVERFDNLTVHTKLSKKEIALDLDGFYDEAWLLVRINDGTPLETRGGSLTNVSGNLYLLKAQAAHVSITLDPEDQ